MHGALGSPTPSSQREPNASLEMRQLVSVLALKQEVEHRKLKIHNGEQRSVSGCALLGPSL